MKIIITIALSIFFMAASFAQSCCSKSSTGQFAMLASSTSFRNAHSLPQKINYTGAIGKWVEFATPDGKKSKAYIFMTETKTDNYLLVFHEWWGLNDNVKKEGEMWFNDLKNVNVVCLDLYDGKLAQDRETAGKYMQANDSKRSTAIIQGALKFLGSNAKIATIGWCFGGGWSLQAAIEAGPQAKACVVYYGMPEKNIERLKKLQADVLGIYAEQDTWINRPLIKEFETNMSTLGKSFTQKWYKADHAFANPSNPQHDLEATADAFVVSGKYLKEKFGLEKLESER